MEGRILEKDIVFYNPGTKGAGIKNPQTINNQRKEITMSVKIIIKRKFKKPLVQENLRAIEALRIPAIRQKGYVSGETLVNSEDHREVVVLSTWSDFDGFKTWSTSEERAKLENELTPHLEEPAKISSFMSGADAINEIFGKIIPDSEVGIT